MNQKFITIKNNKIAIDFSAYNEAEELRMYYLELYHGADIYLND